MSLHYDPNRHVDPEIWLSLDESERIQAVKEYHHREGIRLPNENLHAVVHAVVENQVALGQAYPVQSVLFRLMKEGLDRHEAIHAIGSILAERLFTAVRHQTQGKDLNADYLDKLHKLTAESWKRQAG